FLKDGLEGNWIWFVLLSIGLFIIGVFMFRNLFRKRIQTVFYLTIAFITTVIWFGLPLSKAITNNPEYKPLSELKSWENENNLKVYEFSDMTPELIWDYGDKMLLLKNDDIFSIPKENQFGVLVSKEGFQDFENTFSNFNIEKITRYDMNPKGADSRTHKTRLYRDLYIVTKD